MIDARVAIVAVALACPRRQAAAESMLQAVVCAEKAITLVA